MTVPTLRHWIYALPSSQPFQRLGGTDLWYLVLEVPAASRIEYKLSVTQGENQRWIRDPLNGHLARDPFGANSVLQGAGYERPVWTHPEPNTRPGTLEPFSIHSEALTPQQTRRLRELRARQEARAARRSVIE